MAGRIGLGVAVDYALRIGLDAIYDRVRSLAGLMRERLRTIDGVLVLDKGREQCGIVSFTKEDESPGEIRTRMSGHRINVWSTKASSARLDMDVSESVRASVHYFNTEEEIQRFCELLRGNY